MSVRFANEDDRNFILSSWLRSYSSSAAALSATPHTDAHTQRCDACGKRSLRHDRVEGGFQRWRAGQRYWQGHGALIQRLIASCNVSVYETPADGLVDGWICRDDVRPVLHYLYVRQTARGRGIARALLGDMVEQPIRYTHFASGLNPVRLPRAWEFDPYVLMGGAT